jgi:hypothetical protein
MYEHFQTLLSVTVFKELATNGIKTDNTVAKSNKGTKEQTINNKKLQ